MKGEMELTKDNIPTDLWYVSQYYRFLQQQGITDGIAAQIIDMWIRKHWFVRGDV